MIRILTIEKNTVRLEQIAGALKELSYEVLSAANAPEAFVVLGDFDVQLVLANSDCGGLDFTRLLRETGDITPVIVFSDQTNSAEKRRIFRSGADGYMFLPLDLEELQMRVRSLLWRCRIVEDASLRFGSCCLDARTLSVRTPESEIVLRRLEFLLLQKLLSYPGRIFTRPQLMDEIWGANSDSDPRTVDTHIRRLRKKLREVEDIRLQTVRGLGYRAAVPRRVRRAEKEKNKAYIP